MSKKIIRFLSLFLMLFMGVSLLSAESNYDEHKIPADLLVNGNTQNDAPYIVTSETDIDVSVKMDLTPVKFLFESIEEEHPDSFKDNPILDDAYLSIIYDIDYPEGFTFKEEPSKDNIKLSDPDFHIILVEHDAARRNIRIYAGFGYQKDSETAEAEFSEKKYQSYDTFREKSTSVEELILSLTSGKIDKRNTAERLSFIFKPFHNITLRKEEEKYIGESLYAEFRQSTEGRDSTLEEGDDSISLTLQVGEEATRWVDQETGNDLKTMENGFHEAGTFEGYDFVETKTVSRGQLKIHSFKKSSPKNEKEEAANPAVTASPATNSNTSTSSNKPTTRVVPNTATR